MLVIKEIFQITLDLKDGSGYAVIHLDDDLNINELNLESIDPILVHQITENKSISQPIKYLNESLRRCQRLKRISNNLHDKKTSLFEEIERLIVGYSLVCFQIEEFAFNGSFMSYVKDIIYSIEDYTDLLTLLIIKSIQEESILDICNNFFGTLKKLILEIDKSKKFDLNDSFLYHNVLTCFELFVSFKNVAAIFTKVHGFLDTTNTKPNEFETHTLLGPILSLSPLNPNVALKNYGDNLERSQQQLNMIHESLQAEHKVIIDRLFFIIDKLIRGSSESRSDVLLYFSHIVNNNHLRRGDHSQLNKLSSNAFMSNITLILVKFTQPFLDISYKKIDKIDVNYFNNLNLFIDLSQETRMNSDFREADEFYDSNKKSEDNKPNFISDCFFLTLTYLHYGFGGTILYDEKITPQLKRMQEQLQHLETAASSNDMFSRFAAMRLPSLKKSLTMTQAIKESLHGFFLNPSLQLDIFDFICGVSTFLIRVIDSSHQFPFKLITLPLIPDQVGVENIDNAEYLRKHAPIPFKYYPEFVIEGTINYCNYISRYTLNPMIKNPRLKSFVELATLILRCPELVSNPHLKGKLVQVLSIGAIPLHERSRGFMMEIYESNELVNSNLLYSLLDFYVIVEKTGSSSQFYDKFNARYNISIILEELYRIPSYRQQLIHQSIANSDFFIRFVVRMLNDLTFLLDEGLTNLTEVHNIQNELEHRANGGTPTTEDDDQELQSKLASAERQAKSSCGLADKSMILFNIFTRDIPKAFVSPEIVDRLASMLDYNLESLVGPKCRELKVKNPSKYSFDPKSLLKSLSTVYINLSSQSEFVSAVAKDNRSFNKDLFERAVHVLSNKTGLVNESFGKKLLKFATDAHQQKLTEEEEDLEMGDVPEEFLDPLMYTIMKDPVILPTSRVTIDRSTIKAHLLSDSTDPFNRMPLRLEDVMPNDDLKTKIEEYKKTKKQNKNLC